MKDFREAHPTASSLDDDGCRKLAAAIILQAASDLYDDIKFRMKYKDLLRRNDIYEHEWRKVCQFPVLVRKMQALREKRRRSSMPGMPG